MINNQKMISTRRKLVEPDVDTDEATVGENVRRWPDAAGSGSPSTGSVLRSSISFKPKEPMLSSSVVGRAMRADDRLVPTTHKDGATRAGRRQYLQSNVEIANVVRYDLDLRFQDYEFSYINI